MDSHYELFALTCLSVIWSFTKLLMAHAYRSTDYEVHRNWLAITHSLPLDKWYTESTSEWTLDYPPFFAYFEYFLSQFAKIVDPEMLKVANLNYISPSSVIFHRMSVIVADFVYLYAVYQFCAVCTPCRKTTENSQPYYEWLQNPRLVLGVLLTCNFGLFILDHIHFQYNGFLYGIFLLSVLSMYQGHYCSASVCFATLFNFKHIYLYVAPAYGVYLLRVYCFKSSDKDKSVIWRSFSLQKFITLGVMVIVTCGASLGPFIAMGQLNQVISRLFPFKRGLCHAYWAPNFWTLYNLADKAFYSVGRRLDLVRPSNQTAVMTGGLVQEFDHTVLPSITPLATFILTAVFMLPGIFHLWVNPRGPRTFLKCVIICAYTSFMFGWHVHEKAIMLVLIPLALLAVESKEYGDYFSLLSLTGNVSLLPLVFTKFEQPIIYIGLLAYTLYTFKSLNLLHIASGSRRSMKRSFIKWLEAAYVYGTIPALLYYSCGHHLLGFSQRFPFLPLLLISAYTAIGVVYCYLRLYWTILSEKLIIRIKRA